MAIFGQPLMGKQEKQKPLFKIKDKNLYPV